MFYIDTNTHEESFREGLVGVASERAESSPKPPSAKIYRGKEDFPLLREYVSYVEYEWKSTPPKWDAAFGDAWDDYDPHWYRFIQSINTTENSQQTLFSSNVISMMQRISGRTYCASDIYNCLLAPSHWGGRSSPGFILIIVFTS